MLASTNRKRKVEDERLPSAALRTLMTMGYHAVRSGRVRHACTFSTSNWSDIRNAGAPCCLPGSCSRYGSMTTPERDRTGRKQKKATSIKNMRPRCDLDLRDFAGRSNADARWRRWAGWADGMASDFGQWNLCFHGKPRGHATCWLPETCSARRSEVAQDTRINAALIFPHPLPPSLVGRSPCCC